MKKIHFRTGVLKLNQSAWNFIPFSGWQVVCWRLRVPDCEKQVRHFRHWYGFSPVCIRLCICNTLNLVKLFPPTRHAYILYGDWSFCYRLLLDLPTILFMQLETKVALKFVVAVLAPEIFLWLMWQHVHIKWSFPVKYIPTHSAQMLYSRTFFTLRCALGKRWMAFSTIFVKRGLRFEYCMANSTYEYITFWMHFHVSFQPKRTAKFGTTCCTHIIGRFTWIAFGWLGWSMLRMDNS